MSDRTSSTNVVKLIAVLGTTIGVSLCYLYKCNTSKLKPKLVKKEKEEKHNKELEATKQKLISVLNSQGKINKELFNERDKQNILLAKFDNVIEEIKKNNKLLEEKIKIINDAIQLLKETVSNTHNSLLSNNVRLQKLEMKNPECSFFDNQETTLPHVLGLSTINENENNTLLN